MSGTIGLAAALGLQLSDTLGDLAFIALAVVGVFCAAGLIVTGRSIARQLFRPRRARADDALDVFGGTSDAEIERAVSEWSKPQGGQR